MWTANPPFSPLRRSSTWPSTTTLGDFEPEPLPDIPRGTRVSVQTAPADGDVPERRETGWTMTAPIRGAQDGRVHVGVSVYGRGVVMLPVNSLELFRR